METAADIVAELSGPLARYGELRADSADNSSPESQFSPEVDPMDELTDEESALLDMLGFDPLQIDDLSTPWPMDKLLQLLIALELKELISNEHGYFQRL
ncbi:MAG: hypothetical protein NZ697_03460 [Porticoccaceae bacterium]|nr:hypothetical protein [Porticoccaceae bacterium]